MVGSVEVDKSLLDTGRHGLLSLTNPDTGVKVLLVRLVRSVWVSHLGQDVVLFVQDVISDTGEVGVLEVSVEVDLNDTVGDGLPKLVLARTGSAVEDEEDWLILLGSNGILDVLLVLGEEFWVQLDISWLVDTVHVTETRGNGEVWGDGGKSLVDGKNILWLSVERVVVNACVVNTILLTTSDTDFLYHVS